MLYFSLMRNILMKFYFSSLKLDKTIYFKIFILFVHKKPFLAAWRRKGFLFRNAENQNTGFPAASMMNPATQPPSDARFFSFAALSCPACPSTNPRFAPC